MMRHSHYCLLLVLLLPSTSFGQTIPSDLLVVATSAGGLPSGLGSAALSVEIDADGEGTYARYGSGLGEVIEPSSFILSIEEVGQVWNAIEANRFFDLEEEHSNPSVRDGLEVRLTVRANGTTHSVAARNIVVDALENVVTAMNEVTPDEASLSYEVVEPVDYTPTDVCEQPGKSGWNPDVEASLLTDWGVSPELKLGIGHTPSLAEHFAHPGTVVAYGMPLAEAVRRGIATVSAKGENYGDAVKIEVDNTGSIKKDAIEVKLYLELWGFGASEEIAAVIENAIESAWSGTTSNGEKFTVDVITRVAKMTVAPGTPGYHQIQMHDDSRITEDTYAEVWEMKDAPFGVNYGTGAGDWPSKPPDSQDVFGFEDLEDLYAHEAGHLLGLSDRYNAYNKMPANDDYPEGYWQRESDKAKFTDEQLFNEIAPQHPDKTSQEIREAIEKPARKVIKSPPPGYANDMMANPNGAASQSDIDNLAAQAGLLVEVRPGDVLVHKFGNKQSMAISRNEDIFVSAGETKTLEGLYAACIDRAAGIPSPGEVFDLAPPLSEWKGLEATEFVSTLLRYINDEERYCRADLFTLSVLWRLTNNAGMSDDRIAQYLADAGIDVGFRELDFPNLSNPNFFAPGSGVIIPRELFVPKIVSSSGTVANVGQSVSLTAGLDTPLSSEAAQNLEPTYLWLLEEPEGSSAALGSTEGEGTDVIPDERGIYDVTLFARVPDSLTGASTGGGGTFSARSTLRFVAVDSLVETFESGELTSEGPFWWRTGGGLGEPWYVTDELSHTGTYSVRSGPIGDNESTSLRAQFEQTETGTLSFTYRLASHFSDSLFLTVDGVIHGRWSGADPWTSVSVELPPGFHTVSWTYVKDESDAIGADRAWVDDVFFPKTALITSIEGDDETPGSLKGGPILKLYGNVPNPFPSRTTISYELSQSQPAELIVYDGLGRRIAVLASGLHAAGRHRVQFDASSHASGIYYYRLRTGGEVRFGKMVLSR